jgi:hypothetical protein
MEMIWDAWHGVDNMTEARQRPDKEFTIDPLPRLDRLAHARRCPYRVSPGGRLRRSPDV